MAYFNNLILLILWMIMIGTSNTGKDYDDDLKAIFMYKKKNLNEIWYSAAIECIKKL